MTNQLTLRQQYPVAVKLEVYITDGQQVGAATYVHGMGTIPDDEQMSRILENVAGQLPDGFRLMNRAEATMHYLREEKGYRGPNMVIPKMDGHKWHDPETDVDYADTNNEEEIDEDE